jgi:hypothetical protein
MLEKVVHVLRRGEVLIVTRSEQAVMFSQGVSVHAESGRTALVYYWILHEYRVVDK